MRIPVATPGGGAEDPDGERDRHREGDHGELLRAQLILPARSMLAVENGSGSEAHRLMVMRRLSCGPLGRWARRGAMLTDEGEHAHSLTFG